MGGGISAMTRTRIFGSKLDLDGDHVTTSLQRRNESNNYNNQIDNRGNDDIHRRHFISNDVNFPRIVSNIQTPVNVNHDGNRPRGIHGLNIRNNNFAHPTHHTLLPLGDSSADNNTLAYTGMSLGMNEEDILFNMMYFGGTEATNPQNFGSALNAMVEETIAAHSENNTPYKLKPASSSAISRLLPINLGDIESAGSKECAICTDPWEANCKIIRLHSCNHCFHDECILHWLELQGVCPICRMPIIADVPHTDRPLGGDHAVTHDTQDNTFVAISYVNSIVSDVISRRTS